MRLSDYICIYGIASDGVPVETWRFIMAVLYEEEALFRGCF